MYLTANGEFDFISKSLVNPVWPMSWASAARKKLNLRIRPRRIRDREALELSVLEIAGTEAFFTEDSAENDEVFGEVIDRVDDTKSIFEIVK